MVHQMLLATGQIPLNPSNPANPSFWPLAMLHLLSPTDLKYAFTFSVILLLSVFNKNYDKTIAFIFAVLFGYLLQLFACGASAVVWPFSVLSRFRPGSMSVLGMTRKIGTPTYVCTVTYRRMWRIATKGFVNFKILVHVIVYSYFMQRIVYYWGDFKTIICAK